MALKVVKQKRHAFIFYTVEDVIKVSVVPVVTKSEGKLTKVGVALLPLRGSTLTMQISVYYTNDKMLIV